MHINILKDTQTEQVLLALGQAGTTSQLKLLVAAVSFTDTSSVKWQKSLVDANFGTLGRSSSHSDSAKSVVRVMFPISSQIYFVTLNSQTGELAGSVFKSDL